MMGMERGSGRHGGIRQRNMSLQRCKIVYPQFTNISVTTSTDDVPASIRDEQNYLYILPSSSWRYIVTAVKRFSDEPKLGMLLSCLWKWLAWQLRSTNRSTEWKKSSDNYLENRLNPVLSFCLLKGLTKSFMGWRQRTRVLLNWTTSVDWRELTVVLVVPRTKRRRSPVLFLACIPELYSWVMKRWQTDTTGMIRAENTGTRVLSHVTTAVML